MCKNFPIMLALCLMLSSPYYAENYAAQQKQHTIAGSAITKNNICHYIKPMPLRSSGIIQLGYPLINVVGHFMARLDTKHTHLYIKHTRVDVGFVAQQLHILRHTICLLASFLCTSHLTKHLNNAFIT